MHGVQPCVSLFPAAAGEASVCLVAVADARSMLRCVQPCVVPFPGAGGEASDCF
jgi:hypothetical protein